MENKFQQIKDITETCKSIVEKIDSINNLLSQYKFGMDFGNTFCIGPNESMKSIYLSLIIKKNHLYCYYENTNSPESYFRQSIGIGSLLKKIAAQILEDFIDDYLDSVKKQINTEYIIHD